MTIYEKVILAFVCGMVFACAVVAWKAPGCPSDDKEVQLLPFYGSSIR